MTNVTLLYWLGRGRPGHCPFHIGIWLITLELILTEEPIFSYLDKIRL